MTLRRSASDVAVIALLALVLPALALSLDGCSQKEEEATEETAEAEAPAAEEGVVKVGSKVQVHYTGTLSDSTVFDQSRPDRPLAFVAGTGQMIPGFDKAVLGMKLNEEKSFTIPAEEAYGPKKPEMIMNVARSNLAEDLEPEIGDQITIRNEAGMAYRGKLVGISPDSLLIDFNHPLAGEDLTFDVKVVSIE